MKEISQELIDYIALYGGTPEELSQKEIDAVAKEVEYINNGGVILDSILFGRLPLYQ